MNRRGFSLVELVAVIGIAIILATVAFIYVGGRQGTSELDASASQIVALLRQAQQNALASASSTPWGVHFDNTTSTTAYFALYASSTWSPAAEVSRASLSSRISYSTSSLAVGQTRNVLFAQGTGRVATSTSIAIRVNGSNRAYQIDVSPSGLVQTSTTTAP
jgi:type II secretory pathway pseudopilin PulG